MYLLDLLHDFLIKALVTLSPFDSAYFSHNLLCFLPSFQHCLACSTFSFAFIPDAAEYFLVSLLSYAYFSPFSCLIYMSSELLHLCFVFSFHGSSYFIKFLHPWHSFHLLSESVSNEPPLFLSTFFFLQHHEIDHEYSSLNRVECILYHLFVITYCCRLGCVLIQEKFS